MSCEILELLKRIQFSGAGDMSTIVCPECNAPAMTENDLPIDNHAPECELNQAIQNLETGKWRVYYDT